MCVRLKSEKHHTGLKKRVFLFSVAIDILFLVNTSFRLSKKEEEDTLLCFIVYIFC